MADNNNLSSNRPRTGPTNTILGMAGASMPMMSKPMMVKPMKTEKSMNPGTSMKSKGKK